MVPSRSVYSYILESPFTTTLDIEASMIHFQLKYHNLQGDPGMIIVDLEGENKIYQAV